MESAGTRSAGMRPAIASATAVLPDAVGPKMARTALDGRSDGKRLPARTGAFALDRTVFLRMACAMLRKPGSGLRDPVVERRFRRPAEQVARFRDVRHVSRHL